jgi:hypothetical protein
LIAVHDGKPVNDANISAVTVYFCNAGRKGIERLRVKESHAVALGANAVVLDFRIVWTTSASCGLKAVPAIDEPTNKRFLDFDFLKKGNGAVIQVIFSGDPEAPIVMSGTALDSEQPKRLDAVFGAPAVDVLSLVVLIMLGALYVFASSRKPP